MHFIGGPHTLERTRQGITGYIEHQRQAGYSFWAVELAETGQVIGEAGLYPMNGTGPGHRARLRVREPVVGTGLRDRGGGRDPARRLRGPRGAAHRRGREAREHRVAARAGEARVPQRGRAHGLGRAAAVLRARSCVIAHRADCVRPPRAALDHAHHPTPRTAAAAVASRPGGRASARRSRGCSGRRSRGPTLPAGSRTSSTRRTTSARGRCATPATCGSALTILTTYWDRQRPPPPARHRCAGVPPRLRAAAPAATASAPRGQPRPARACSPARSGCWGTGSPTPTTTRPGAGGASPSRPRAERDAYDPTIRLRAATARSAHAARAAAVRAGVAHVRAGSRPLRGGRRGAAHAP